MSWNSSSRSSRLPVDWLAIRKAVLIEADWICQIGYSVCTTAATDVDHTRRGDDHSRSNLRAACAACHLRKSSHEGNARRRELKALRSRPQERHPGSR